MSLVRESFLILISFFLCGCASVAVDSVGGINGGSAKIDERAKAAVFDIVTLPIQAVVLPVALVAHSARNSNRERKREEQEKVTQEHKKLLNAEAAKINSNLSVIVSQDYLSKDSSSIE